MPRQGVESDEKGWSFLINLLIHHRLKRPLDGIILSIPCDELIGPEQLSSEEILLRAKHINNKLWNLQTSLGMKVPVYLLITKCDKIKGFKDFANELPSTLLKGMLGWSCPYSLENGYSSSWIQEIFNFMNKSLHKIRAEIYTEGSAEEGRDGLFIFKVAFKTLKKNLDIYLNNIFKETTYHESFFLRGVYFCGDTGTPTAVAEHKQNKNQSVPSHTLDSAIDIPFKEYDGSHISFIHDLFKNKIFQEYGLAHPVRQMLISTARTLNLAKILAAVLILVWSIGLYVTQERLSKGNQTLIPFLQEVDQTIHNINRRNFELTTIENITYLNDQSLKVLKLMSEIEVESSFALSIPASWFTNYDNKLRAAITAAWNTIILRSFYSGLIQKARKLFMFDSQSNEDEIAYLNPLQSSEFTRLKNFVEEVTKLEDNVIRFNNLENSLNMKDVGRLINYLFDRDLPKQFYENTSYYKLALGNTAEQKIKLVDFSTSAGRKLNLLFKEFLNNTLNFTKENSMLAMLIKSFDSLSQAVTTQAINEKKIFADIQYIFAAATAIRNNEFNWIEGEVFLPGEVYTTVINLVANSRILGVSITNDLLAEAQKAFLNYKENINQLDVSLIGKIFATQNQIIKASLSTPYELLLENLTIFLKQPFMKKQSAYKAIIPLPAGRLLFWDETTLRSAAKIVESYEKYTTDKLPEVSAELKPILETIGRYALRNKVYHLIATAENFQISPHILTNFEEQEALNQQIQNLKTVQPEFSRLLNGFLKSDVSANGTLLRELLLNQTHELLHKIDNLLTRDELYSVGGDSFSWWDGQEMLGLRAFGVYDVDDMKSYLNAQFERIRFISKELMAPVLSYLSLPYLNGVPENISLITKWMRILTQVEAYEKQTPNNSVNILHHFLMFDMNQMSENMCVDAVLAYDIYEKTGDYFLDRRNKIRRLMIQRCEIMARQKSIENYNVVAEYFNRHLAGRFPFSKDNEFYGDNEATVEDINTFLTLFDRLDESQRKAIDELIDFPSSASSPSQFLRQIDLLAPILKTSLDANSNQYTPKVDFEIDFRTDRNQESAGNKIIDWSLQVDNSDIDFRDDKRAGQWIVGNPLCVILRWASDGPTVPTMDVNQPNLTTSDYSARFSFNGRWSLIRLLKTHAIDYKAYENGKPIPITLQFVIPTAYKKVLPGEKTPRQEIAKVFLRLSLFDSNKKEISKAATAEKPKTDEKTEGPILMEKLLIPLPVFPLNAPSFDYKRQTHSKSPKISNL